MNGHILVTVVLLAACSQDVDSSADTEKVKAVCIDCGGCECIDGTQSRGSWCGPEAEKPDWVCTGSVANCANDCVDHGGVAVTAKCGREGLALDECVRGTTFADCGGWPEPHLWCRAPEDEGSPDCLWFTGCPAAGYNRPCPAPLDCATCSAAAGFLYSWGQEPWDAERAMDVEVETGALDGAVAAPDLTCEAGCSVDRGEADAPPGCGLGAGFCGGDEANGPVFAQFDDAPAASGMAKVMLYRPDLFGWALHLEVDGQHQPPRARACLTPYTDASGSCPEVAPACASGGVLQLDRVLATPAEIRDAHGRFRVTFPEFPTRPFGWNVRGLVLVGAF